MVDISILTMVLKPTFTSLGGTINYGLLTIVTYETLCLVLRVDPMNINEQGVMAYGKIHHVLFMGRQEALWENYVHVMSEL